MQHADDVAPEELSKAVNNIIITSENIDEDLRFDSDGSDIDIDTDEQFIENESIDNFAYQGFKTRKDIIAALTKSSLFDKHIDKIRNVVYDAKLITSAINDTSITFSSDSAADRYLIGNFHAPPVNLDIMLQKTPSISYDDFIDNLIDTYANHADKTFSIQEILDTTDDMKYNTNGLILYKLSKYGFFRRPETEKLYNFILERGLEIGRKYCFNEQKYPNTLELYVKYSELIENKHTDTL